MSNSPHLNHLRKPGNRQQAPSWSNLESFLEKRGTSQPSRGGDDEGPKSFVLRVRLVVVGDANVLRTGNQHVAAVGRAVLPAFDRFPQRGLPRARIFRREPVWISGRDETLAQILAVG